MIWGSRTAFAAAVLVASAVGTTAASAGQPAEPDARGTRPDIEAVTELADPVPVAESPPALPDSEDGRASGDVSTMALPDQLCYGINYGDADEPGDGLLDVWNYGLGFDCVTSTWVMSVDTMDMFDESAVGWFELGIDTNGRTTDGCDGFDFSAFIFHDGGGMVGGLARTPSCDPNGWTDVPNAQMTYYRDAGNHIGFTFSGARFASVPTMRWASRIVHWDPSDLFDLMPDTGLRTSPGNPCGMRCFYLTNGTTGGAAEVAFKDDQPAHEILIGDWDGNGGDSFGFRYNNSYALKNALAPTAPDVSFSYGRSNDVVLVGDWDGDGVDTLAVRRGNHYYMKNTYGGGAADVTVAYGRAGDVVLVGDWDGNGTDTLAVRRGSHYHIKNSFSGGPADVVVAYGRPADAVLVGDWDGDGDDTLGVRRAQTYYLKNTISGGAADSTFAYGRSSDVTFVGDWNADGRDSLGVRR